MALELSLNSAMVVADVNAGNAFTDASSVLQSFYNNVFVDDQVLSVIIPNMFTQFKPDDASVGTLANPVLPTMNSSFYGTTGSINKYAYANVVNYLISVVNKQKQGSFGPNFRIMLLDSSHHVGFDSAKATAGTDPFKLITGVGSNVYEYAFANTNAGYGLVVLNADGSIPKNDDGSIKFSLNSLWVNEPHMGRPEFLHAYETASAINRTQFAAVTRPSSTLKAMESRGVIFCSDNAGIPQCSFAPSREYRYISYGLQDFYGINP